MADRVIIVGANRKGELIPIGELKQMMGRAGRGHESGICTVDLVVEQSDEEYVAEGMHSDEESNVVSVFGDDETLAFHLLPEICTGKVTDEAQAVAWHLRSFHAFCGKKADMGRVLDSLAACGAVSREKNGISPTPLGEIASACYFHPAAVAAWKNSFSHLFEQEMEYDDLALAWALGNVPTGHVSGDFGNHRFAMEECQNRMPAGFDIEKGCLVLTTLWWNVFGGAPVGKMKHHARRLKDDFGRIARVLCAVDDRICHWDKEEYFKQLVERARRSVPSELAELCSIPGITKGAAAALYDMGIRTQQEYEEAKDRIDIGEIVGGGL